uniref:Uncharacterized protein n=1 Tax=Arion vulgaris TaxID=1028688 RepID=A0A0B6Y730_9EUPU
MFHFSSLSNGIVDMYKIQNVIKLKYVNIAACSEIREYSIFDELQGGNRANEYDQ